MVVLAIILFFALFRSSTTFLPYTSAKSYTTYEGLVGNDDPSEASSSAPTPIATQSESDAALNAAANPLTQEAVNPELSKILEKVYKESKGGNLAAGSATIPSEAFSSKEGFESNASDKVTASTELLSGSNYGTTTDYVIDRFSHVNTSKDGCVSSGLTNSKGPLCLSADLVSLLKTRGGNATGESEIGK